MSLAIKASNNSGAGTEIPEQGQHLAVLIGVIDLGTHNDTYQGKTTKKRLLYLIWELTASKVEGTTNNHLIGQEFGFSFSKKSKLRLMAEKWRGAAYAEGEEFDPEKMLGRSCIVNVVHKKSGNGERTYANFDGATKPMKGQEVPPATRPLVFFEVGGKHPVPEYDWLPYHWLKSAEKMAPLKEHIADSAEMRGEEVEIPDGPQPAPAGAPLSGTSADPIPF
jgi:hypothetical protein